MASKWIKVTTQFTKWLEQLKDIRLTYELIIGLEI